MSETLKAPDYTTQDPAKWREQIQTFGYVIVQGVVPPEHLQATIDDIWRHTGASADDPESWYQPDIIRPNGMLEMYHYQSVADPSGDGPLRVVS